MTLRIDDEDFTPWRSDAGCTIRPQSLIGEKFVECEPGSTSAPRAARRSRTGTARASGCCRSRTTARRWTSTCSTTSCGCPYRQRFSILLSEFGAGLAGRGDQLNEVIHRANPALRETDKLLAILAKQNRVLARLARDSDTALAPIAREREQGRRLHRAGQRHRRGLGRAQRGHQARLERLPDFLRELRPLMADLDKVAVQGTPLLRDLGTAAPQMGRLIKGLGTFSEAANESFPSLGDALEQRPARPDQGAAADPAAGRARPRGQARRSRTWTSSPRASRTPRASSASTTSSTT